MAGERKYTRIPPASTGDRITHEPHALVPYDGLVGDFILDSFVTFETSGIRAHVHSVFPETGTTGFIGVHYDIASTFAGTIPTPGENINDADGNLIATIRLTPASIDLFTANNVIVGKNNPDYGVTVDQFGSLQTTYAEGQPQLDAFGKLRTSGATHLGEYVFGNEDELTSNFSLTVTNKADKTNITSEINYSGTENSVTVEVNNPSDFAATTSKTYHHYIPGSSHLFMGTALFSGGYTLGAGTPSYTGVVRSFGLFDANNGFMFMVGPDGYLYLNIRSNTSGTVVNTIVASSNTSDSYPNFNSDYLDGSSGINNPSGMQLDLSKDNQYWIDVQWHGAGRVRFGVYHNGQRVTVHEYFHNNRYTVPVTKTASLPVCSSIYAYTNAEVAANPIWGSSGLGYSTGASSSTEVYTRSWSMSVWTEVDVDLKSLGRPQVYTSGHLEVPSTEFTYLFSMAPKPSLPGGGTNHSLYVPTKLTAYAYDNDVSGSGTPREAIVHFRIGVNSVHSGHEFSDIPGTNFQVSSAGTAFEDGNTAGIVKKIQFEDMFNGRYEDNLTDTYVNIQNGAFKNSSDDGGTHQQLISEITGSSTTSLTATADAGTSTNLVVTSTSNVLVGASISGSGVPTSTVVDAVVDSTNLTLSNATTTSYSGGETFNITNPVALRIDDTTNANIDRWVLREPFTSTFTAFNDGHLHPIDFTGLTLPTDEVYLRITGLKTGVLYTDSTLTTPLTSTGTYSGSSAKLFGFVGPQLVFSFFAHEQLNFQNPRVMFSLQWKEILQ